VWSSGAECHKINQETHCHEEVFSLLIQGSMIGLAGATSKSCIMMSGVMDGKGRKQAFSYPI